MTIVTRRSAARIALAASMAIGPLLAASPAAARNQPAADQTIEADQAVVDGRAEISSGHADIGPRWIDGRWDVLVHDATSQPSVWRRVDDVVIRIADAARATVPDDPAYRFLGADPGDPVWVIPQTEMAGVVWLGWNTQDPAVMSQVDRGVSLRLVGATGPGAVSVYLQSGDLGGPQVLWEPGIEAEPLWVEVNIHTHANWAFTRPGAHVLRLEVSADLRDGSSVSRTVDLRVAVGDGVDVEAVATAAFDPTESDGDPADQRLAGGDSARAGGDSERATADRAAPSGETDGASGLLVGVVVGGGAVGAIVFGAVSARSAAARRAAERGTADDTPGGGGARAGR